MKTEVLAIIVQRMYFVLLNSIALSYRHRQRYRYRQRYRQRCCAAVRAALCQAKNKTFLLTKTPKSAKRVTKSSN